MIAELPPLKSLRLLEHLLHADRKELREMASHVGRYYTSFDRRAGGSPKWRHIDSPAKPLKELQSAIHRQILSRAALPDTMLGGISGRSLSDNAEFHLRQPLVATLDIRDFFPRTSNERAYRVFTEIFDASPAVASMLTTFTTFHRHIPQGAPTSCTLANLCILSLHQDVVELAKRMGLRVSFWVDDITISGPATREAIEPIVRIVQRHGYAVRRRKTEVMTAGTSQRVTGSTVNRKKSVGQVRKNLIRERILELAAEREIAEWQLRSVRGQIAQVASICAVQGESIQRLADRILPICGRPGERPRTDETRECRDPSKHRYRASPG